MSPDYPLTLEQLQAFGFAVTTKKRKGIDVFDQCHTHHQDYSWEESEMIGIFYNNPPSFKEIINRVMENVKDKTERDVKERISSKLTDLID